jgi:hypothetical protein
MFYSNPFRPNLNQQGVILQDIQRANDSFYSLSQTYVNGDVTSGKVLLAATADNTYNANNATTADSATNANHATTADSATNANHATTADSATNANNATSAYNATYADKIGVTASTSYNLGHFDGLKIYSNTPSIVISNQWGTNDYSDKGIFEIDLMLGGSNGFIFFWAPNNVNYSNTNFQQQFTQINQQNAPVTSAAVSQWNGFGIMTPYAYGATKAFIKMRVCCNTEHKYIQYQANAYSVNVNFYAQEIGNVFWNDNTSWDTVGGMYLVDTNYNPISSGYISGVIRRVL